MSIHGIPSIQSAQPLQSVARAAQSTEAPVTTQPVAIKDDIQFSSAAQGLESTANSAESLTSNVRLDLVNRIRSEIADGSYDTPEKMDVAIDRLIGRMNPK